jgi:DNA-binding FadR family transcriptional regulator
MKGIRMSNPPRDSLDPPPVRTAGRPARQRPVPIHIALAHDIGKSIVAGRLRPGHVLQGELEASEDRQVSRTAYREALRMLGAKGLIHSRPRAGTRVSDTSDWHLLDPDVLSWIFMETPQPSVLHALFELRTIIEPAAARLAARRRNSRHLQRMQVALDGMRRNTLHHAEGRDADQAFHAAILAATANPFLISLTNGVTAAVDGLTQYKLRLQKVERNPVADHARVFDAIAARDGDAAHAAMTQLIRLAIQDMPASQRPKPAAVPGMHAGIPQFPA